MKKPEETSVSERFSKERRILKRPQFQKVFDEGRKFIRPSLVVFILHRKDEQSARLGLAVSRKVGNAVVRNRIKRRLRELFRRGFGKELYSLDIVIIARHSASIKSIDDLTSQLDSIPFHKSSQNG